MRTRLGWALSVPALPAAVRWFVHTVTTPPSLAIEWPFSTGRVLLVLALPLSIAMGRSFSGRPTCAYAVAFAALAGAQLWNQGGDAAVWLTGLAAHAAALGAIGSALLLRRSERLPAAD